MSVIRIYGPDEPQYFRLKLFCDELNQRNPAANFRVQTVYFDFGQNWRWTTILAKSRALNMDYQVLSPAQYEQILNPYLPGWKWNDLLEDVLKSVS